jgi:type II secretory pathway pseudopilin PulG
MSSQTQIRREARRDERGYVLLMLLMMGLLVIAAAIVVPTIKFQIERDREEEMIHRGVQYSRAIRAYYKKFGRYPIKLEDLETTNNLKFLRKRYKDPVNCANGKCEDFKLLHFGDVKMFGSAGITGATNVADFNNSSPGGSSSAFGGSGGLGQSSLGGSGGFGGSSSSGFGSNSFGSQNQQTGGASGTDSSQNGQNGSNASGGDNNGSSNGSSSGGSNGQVIGGGPIVGVVSNAKCPPKPKDKCQGYREFNHKNKYSDWQFIYDPSTDRGGLLMTPNQPPIQGFSQNLNQQNGTNGTNTNQSGGFGTIGGTSNGFSSGFGNSPGTQNSPSSGTGNSNPPSSSPQQQQ